MASGRSRWGFIRTVWLFQILFIY